MKRTKRRTVKGLIALSVLVLATSSAAAANNTSSSFQIENSDVESSVSVNQFGKTVANVTSKYYDNKTGSRTFDVSVSGNVSQIVDAPSQFTLFNNQSESFPLVANVPLSQEFGVYNGTLSLTAQGNASFNDSINVAVNVVDDVKPVFENIEVNDVQATESQEWMVDVSDNLNVSKVNGSVMIELDRMQGNESVTVNESFKQEVVFEEESDGSFKFVFDDTEDIGQYYLNLTAFDSSGNSVHEVVPFEVTGLDSIQVERSNFVFDTIRPKEDTSEIIVDSGLEGKPFTVYLENVSYGGNETVKVGVLPPNSGSPEILQVGESREYTEKGEYELVLLHEGNNEIKGTHRVTGEVTISKPDHHVKPVSERISFSGTVKNLDKPPEMCERIKEYDSCIAYSLDQARSMFDSEYNLSDSSSKDYAYLIGRIPTSSVEGSTEWGDESSLTFGQYNKTITELDNVTTSRDNWKSKAKDYEAMLMWIPFLLIGVGGGTVAWWIKIGQFVSIAQNGRRMIEKADIVDPEEGLK